MEKVKPMIDAAGASGANILCLQEAWTMPLAVYIPRDDVNLLNLSMERLLSSFRNLLKRDINHGETICNSAVIIGNHGNIIGIHRKAHSAAIANRYFVGSINRVGTEVFPNPFTAGEECLSILTPDTTRHQAIFQAQVHRAPHRFHAIETARFFRI